MIHSHILKIYIKRNTQNYFILDILEKKEKEIYLYLFIYKAKRGKQESKNNSTTEYIGCKEFTFTVNQSEVTQPWKLQTMQCFNATSRSTSSAYGLATANCMPTYAALVCHTQLTAHMRWAQKPQDMHYSSAPVLQGNRHNTGPQEATLAENSGVPKGQRGTCCFINTSS